MRKNTIVMVGIAVVFGLLAVFVAQGWLTAAAWGVVDQLLALNMAQHGDDAGASLVAAAEAMQVVVGDLGPQRGQLEDLVAQRGDVGAAQRAAAAAAALRPQDDRGLRRLQESALLQRVLRLAARSAWSLPSI